VPHGTAGCAGGHCTVAACDSGWDDCNGDVPDGCERNLLTDPDACGACGQVCSNLNMVTRTCGGGDCNGTCQTGFKDCNHDKLTDGCESESAVDPNNCGDCDVSCSNNHMATRTCQGGICNGTCASGYLDCDADKQSNGCEKNGQTDPLNCSACGTNCTSPLPAHATAGECLSGSCEVDTCESGFHDQDGTFSNGCECQADGVPDACGSASAYGAPVTLTGNNLVPAGDFDWFRFTFTTNGTCIKPKIAITSGDPAVVFDVFTNCSSGSAQCPDHTGGAVGVRTWEVTYSNCADHGTIDPVPETVGSFWQIALVYYVKVYASGSSSTCLPYTIAVTQ
jgi:hypothetical protein